MNICQDSSKPPPPSPLTQAPTRERPQCGANHDEETNLQRGSSTAVVTQTDRVINSLRLHFRLFKLLHNNAVELK